MPQRTRGVTLAELLVVVAIIVVLAGLIFPTFRQVRAAAKQATCAQNFHQGNLVTSLYMGDYDDRLMPINHQPGSFENSENDRTWVQLLLPYVTGSFSSFQCPADTSDRPRPDETFDQDLVLGNAYSKYFTASLRTNLGYNYMYLSPVVKQGALWASDPKYGSDISDPHQTLLFIDSVWARKKPRGEPYGGGNWLVIPPCRYEKENGQVVDSFGTDILDFFSVSQGWTQSESGSSTVYGGAWAWHNGKIMVVSMDGSTRLVTPAQLRQGCDYKDGWGGLIVDTQKYPWDLE